MQGLAFVRRLTSAAGSTQPVSQDSCPADRLQFECCIPVQPKANTKSREGEIGVDRDWFRVLAAHNRHGTSPPPMGIHAARTVRRGGRAGAPPAQPKRTAVHPMGRTDPLRTHGPIRATRGVCATPCPSCSLLGSGAGFGHPVQGPSRIHDLRAISATVGRLVTSSEHSRFSLDWRFPKPCWAGIRECYPILVRGRSESHPGRP